MFPKICLIRSCMLMHHWAWLKTAQRKLGPKAIHISHDNCLYLAQPQTDSITLRANSISMYVSNHPVWSQLLPSTMQLPSHVFPHLQRSLRARRARANFTPSVINARQARKPAIPMVGHRPSRTHLLVSTQHICAGQLLARSPRPWEKEGSYVAMCWTQELKRLLNLKMGQHWGIWELESQENIHVFPANTRVSLGFM